MTDIPLSTATLHLKYIDVSKLNSLAQVALHFGFGRFFSLEPPNELGAEFLERRRGRRDPSGTRIRSETERPFRYRRFAGSVALPRGRYYSVSDSPVGDDHGTLMHELIAYTDHEKCGRFAVFDAADPIASRELDCGQRPWEGAAGMIALRFIDDEYGASPLVRDLLERGMLTRAATTDVAIPYEVRKETLAGILDLRQPSAQSWLHERLRQGLPGVAYEYSAGRLSRRLSWSDEGAGEEMDIQAWLEGSDRVTTYAPCDSWGGCCHGGPDNFIGLLPYLLFPVRGGSPVTDAVGRWLISSGVNGLVYPSARNDVECVLWRGGLEHATGWNFVDYRGASVASVGPVLIIEPDSWRFPGSAVVHGGGSGLNVPHCDVRVDPADAESAGSWRVADQGRKTRSWFIGQQRMATIARQVREALEAAASGADLGAVAAPRARASRTTDQSAPTSQVPGPRAQDGLEDALNRFASFMRDAATLSDPSRLGPLLLELREFLTEAPSELPAQPQSLAAAGADLTVGLWKLMFKLGSSSLFRPTADRKQSVEEAILWLKAASMLPIEQVSPADWARTQGELSTAYKNRLQGDSVQNGQAAMACINRAIDAFSPTAHRREWLISINQRALVRLETPQGDTSETRGDAIERAVAELAFVASRLDSETDFALWSSTWIALASAYVIREYGYFVDNAERGREVLEAVLKQVGDPGAMVQQGTEPQRLNIAAGAALSLARAYQVRRRGDPDTNRQRAQALLQGARKAFAVLGRVDALQEIDERLAGFGASSAVTWSRKTPTGQD